jgi:hypothetical protein
MSQNTSTTPVNRWGRFGALCGPAYILLILVGNQLDTGSGQDPHPSGAKDLADFGSVPSAAQVVGFTMELLGFLAFMFFLGWLVHALRSRASQAPWLADTVGVAGVIMLAVKMASAMPLLAGHVDHTELSPSAARVLMDMNGAAFVVTFLPFGVFVAATGAALLTTGLLGKVAGWTGVVIGALTVAVTLVTRVDPINTNVMPFLAALLWVLVIGIRLAWKGPRAVRGDAAAGSVPAMA